MTTPDFRGDQIQVGKIISSASNGTNARIIIYSASADTSPFNVGNINTSVFNTALFGTDTFLFVSGAISKKDVQNSWGVFAVGGDAVISGTLYGLNGITGSLTKLTDGSSYLIAGPNITITTQSNGAVAISGSASSGLSSGSVISLPLVDFASMQSTTHEAVGQIIFNASTYSGSVDLFFALAASTGSVSSSVKLLCIPSGTYVEIGGTGVTTITTTNTTPTKFSSVNLRNATNFITSSEDIIYELQLAVSDATKTATVGGGCFRVTASMNTTSSISVLSGTFGGGDPDASYLVLGLTSSLSNERVLTAGPGITFNDSGANGILAISASLLAGPNITINQIGNAYAISGAAGASPSVTGSSFPDSGLPRLAFTNYEKISIVPSKLNNETGSYNNKVIRLTFQDGIQRSYVGNYSDMHITSSIVGQTGIDSGSNITTSAGNNWYYIYMVPSGSNASTSSLSVIASRQAPTGTTSWGPSGYTNFRYIGPVFYKTSNVGSGFASGVDEQPAAGFQPFYQINARTYNYLGSYALYSGTNELATSSVNVTTPTQPTTFGLPSVASKIFANVVSTFSASVGGDETTALRHRIYAPLSYILGYKPTLDLYNNNLVKTDIFSVEMPVGYPLENQPYDITHRTSIAGTVPSSYSNFISFNWVGFEDGYLDTTYVGATSLTGSLNAGSITGGGDPNAAYLVLGLTSSLSNERVLTAGPGITFNDSGANGILAVSASLLAGSNISINQVGSSYAISGTNFFTSGSITTTDNTPTLLTSYTFTANSIYDMDFVVLAKQDTFENYARFKRNIVAGRNGSLGAFIHASSSYAVLIDVNTSTWNCSFTTSSNDIQLWVTGTSATNITWTYQLSRPTVS